RAYRRDVAAGAGREHDHGWAGAEIAHVDGPVRREGDVVVVAESRQFAGDGADRGDVARRARGVLGDRAVVEVRRVHVAGRIDSDVRGTVEPRFRPDDTPQRRDVAVRARREDVDRAA